MVTFRGVAFNQVNTVIKTSIFSTCTHTVVHVLSFDEIFYLMLCSPFRETLHGELHECSIMLNFVELYSCIYNKECKNHRGSGKDGGRREDLGAETPSVHQGGT